MHTHTHIYTYTHRSKEMYKLKKDGAINGFHFGVIAVTFPFPAQAHTLVVQMWPSE